MEKEIYFEYVSCGFVKFKSELTHQHIESDEMENDDICIHVDTQIKANNIKGSHTLIYSPA